MAVIASYRTFTHGEFVVRIARAARCVTDHNFSWRCWRNNCSARSGSWYRRFGDDVCCDPELILRESGGAYLLQGDGGNLFGGAHPNRGTIGIAAVTDDGARGCVPGGDISAAGRVIEAIVYPVICVDRGAVWAGAADHHVLCIYITKGHRPRSWHRGLIEGDGERATRLAGCNGHRQIGLADG